MVVTPVIELYAVAFRVHGMLRLAVIV